MQGFLKILKKVTFFITDLCIYIGKCLKNLKKLKLIIKMSLFNYNFLQQIF